MPNTYSQLYIHVVFAVKRRENLIASDWKTNLFKFMNGIVVNKRDKIMCLNGVSDHVHILLSISPATRISDIVRDIKANSSRWINENKLVRGKFEWQNGFGAFSVSPGRVDRTIDYIKNQENHHKQKSFREEYLRLLKLSGVEFDERYIFETID